MEPILDEDFFLMIRPLTCILFGMRREALWFTNEVQ